MAEDNDRPANSSEGQLPPALSAEIPASLTHPDALRFWTAALLTGVATGIGAILLTRLLELVQHLLWPGPTLLDGAVGASAQRHLLILFGAGAMTGMGQLLLKQLTSGNGIDTTAAIWFHAGRVPALRTLGSAVLSVIVVGMGVSLGREGAPKQAGAVFANFFADRARLSDEQRRLLVACGAGAGMGAAYGVPLGGAMFSLEVMRGVLALRYVLPALMVSIVATGVSWLGLPNTRTYEIPHYANTPMALLFAIIAGPIAGVMSVAYVRMIMWAERNKPEGWRRFTEPMIVMTALGALSIWYPQLLGNGKRRLGTCFYRQPGNLADSGAAVFEACGHHNVHAERSARRSLHSVADLRSDARCSAGACFCVVGARSTCRPVRASRRWRRDCRYHAGPNLSDCAHDGAHGPRSLIRSAHVAGHRHRNTGGTNDYATLHLRRQAER